MKLILKNDVAGIFLDQNGPRPELVCGKFMEDPFGNVYFSETTRIGVVSSNINGGIHVWGIFDSWLESLGKDQK